MRFFSPKTFIAVIVTLAVTIIFFQIFKKSQTSPQRRTIIQVGNARYSVDVADEEHERSQGLSGRQSLGVEEGMLFVFPTEDQHGFWMKDMHFPLDFVWIRDNLVIGVTENVPPPESSSSSLPVYRPPEIVDMVLEINAGQIAKDGVKRGDSVIRK